jgi:geranylgeranyl pyrophosphate synthase
VREACEKVVVDYTNKALQILAELPQNAATAQLRTIAEKLNRRTS